MRPTHALNLIAGLVRFFTESMRCTPETLVNRIEWEYVDG